jgi:hypothetical protein
MRESRRENLDQAATLTRATAMLVGALQRDRVNRLRMTEDRGRTRLAEHARSKFRGTTLMQGSGGTAG